jgi:hypothetical protein
MLNIVINAASGKNEQADAGDRGNTGQASGRAWVRGG